MKKLGLLFDLDGTLIDSGPDLVTAVNLTLAELGLSPMGRDQVARRLGHGPGRLIRDSLGPGYEELAEKAYPIFKRHYEAHLVEFTHIYEGIVEMLEHYHPVARMALITNKAQNWTEEIIRQLGLLRYLDPVLGHDALPTHKPDPGPLLETASRWNLDVSACIMIGDSEMDIVAGKAARMWTCGVTWGNRPPGFMADLNPDFLVHHPRELLDLFEEWTRLAEER